MTYVDGILKTILDDALSAGVYTLQPARLLELMPCVVAKHIPGGGSADIRFSSTRGIVQLDAYHPDKRGAYDLARAAVDALVDAWRRQTQTPDGVIATISSQSDPAELRLPDQAGGFTRYTATLAVTCRA